MELPIPKLWEFHPMLVHFPIAFLLAGVTMELVALRRPNEMIYRAAAWLFLVGTAFGWLVAAAGGLAYFTVPAHTEAGHDLMYWHLGQGLAMLTLFTWVSIMRWRRRTTAATKQQLIASLIGAALLMSTGHVGALLVYRHGAGVDPKILAPEIRDGHSHQNGHSEGSNSHESQDAGSDSHSHERP